MSNHTLKTVPKDNISERYDVKFGLYVIFLLLWVQAGRGQTGSKPPSGSTDPSRPPGPTEHDPGSANRYNPGSTAPRARKRTAPYRLPFVEDCEYYLNYCMKVYKTGVLCGRTIYYRYANFLTYCQMDYVNCMERYEVWQLVHMGECLTIKRLKDYLYYEITDDDFLDRDYVSDD